MTGCVLAVFWGKLTVDVVHGVPQQQEKQQWIQPAY